MLAAMRRAVAGELLGSCPVSRLVLEKDVAEAWPPRFAVNAKSIARSVTAAIALVMLDRGSESD